MTRAEKQSFQRWALKEIRKYAYPKHNVLLYKDDEAILCLSGASVMITNIEKQVSCSDDQPDYSLGLHKEVEIKGGNSFTSSYSGILQMVLHRDMATLRWAPTTEDSDDRYFEAVGQFWIDVDCEIGKPANVKRITMHNAVVTLMQDV